MYAGYVRDDPVIRTNDFTPRKSVIELQDLTPQKDPKGGSPKTPPGGIRLPRQTMPEPTPYPPYMTTDIEPKKIGFFHIQFRDLLYAGSLFALGLLFIFNKQSEAHDLLVKVATSEKVQEQMAATISLQQKLIDANTSSIQRQQDRNLEQDKRIAEAQSQLVNVIPALAKIETKLNFVADLIDGKSKR